MESDKVLEYLIVEFKDNSEIAIIPDNWCHDEDVVKWPPYKSSTRLNNAVAKREPPSDTWSEQELERVLYRSASYEKARAKLKQAEVDSDLQTDDGSVQKRKRRAPRRIESGTDSDDSDSVISRLPKKPKTIVHSTPKLPSPPPRLSLPRLVDTSDTRSPEQSASSQNLPTPSGGNLLVARARDAQFLTLLEKIREEQKEQHRLLQLLLSRGPAVEENNSVLPDGVSFPISTVEDMDSLNELLQESEKYSHVVKYLTFFGGSTVREMVNRMLKEVVTNNLALKYNLQGKKGKLPLSNLKIMGALYRALQRNIATKAATRKDFEVEVRKWLTGARDREAGRKKRAKVALAVPLQPENDDTDTEDI